MIGCWSLIMKNLFVFLKLFIFTAIFAVFSVAGISLQSYGSELTIASIQEPPPSPPGDPDPPPPPPDPFTTV
jgi:hypothetical protein